jgi:hypothetical protein
MILNNGHDPVLHVRPSVQFRITELSQTGCVCTKHLGDGRGPQQAMPNTGRLICHRKLLQITAEEIGRISMRAATGRGSIHVPRFHCRRSAHYNVHCVGDVIMTARYIISTIVLFSTRSFSHVSWGKVLT